MSIQHTVVFTLKHAPGSAAEANFLDTAQARLSSIPGVQDFLIQRQVSPKSELAWQFSMRFADQAAYDTYNEHPTHTTFVETRWVPEVADFHEYDFTVR